MSKDRMNGHIAEPQPIDSERRRLLGAAGAGVAAVTLGAALAGAAGHAEAKPAGPLRWGFVGTGGIANGMAPRAQQAAGAELVAVSSRKMETAQVFADKHGVGRAFDSWADMIAWDGIDAIYVATPTSVREEICVAAANGGKHVLGEKPFANLPSLKRITAACRSNGVGFMDGTHFVHHPRTAQIKALMEEQVGWPWSVDSAFQFNLTDIGNIRLIPKLEPYGAIGDTGWYTMRAAVEYLGSDVEVVSASTHIRREKQNNAVVSGSGVLLFDDGSTSTWNCGFESGAGIQDLRISGAKGVIRLDDYVINRPDNQPASYELRQGWQGVEQIEVPGARPAATLMFEDFATMLGDPEKMEASIRASERTQEWLDAVWISAIENEGGAA